MTKTIPTWTTVFAIMAGLLSLPALAASENEGLAQLDRAVELKLLADSEADLNRVVALCEQALQKGLSKDHEQFARQLLSATLYQHAAAFAQGLFSEEPVNPEALFLRQLALPKLEKAVRYNDQFGAAYYLIARLQALPGGDRRKARQAVDKAIQLARDDQQLRSKALALRADLRTRDDEKLADYNEALRVDPANKEALKSRGLFFLRKGEHEKATQDFLKLLGEDHDNVVAFQALVEALTDLKQYDQALAQVAKAIELDPRSSFNYTLRARIYALQNDLDAALDDLNHALKLEPREVPALLLRAQLRQSRGELKAARRDVERALLFQPGLVQAILLRSMIAAAEHDYTAAIADMEKLVHSDPKNVTWRLQVAALYAADERPRKAIAAFSDILKEDPRNVLALRGRADALLSIGKQAEAIADYEAALKIEPNHSGVLNNLAWVLATSPDQNLRDGRRAIQLGTRACEVTHYKEAYILSTLAAGYAETGDFESAIKWSTKAVQLGKGEMKEQLKQELESYKKGKPWRELQQVKDKPEPTRGGGDFRL